MGKPEQRMPAMYKQLHKYKLLYQHIWYRMQPKRSDKLRTKQLFNISKQYQ